MATVEVAVIGRGMIGSAAARHLAEGGTKTALIGPSEPDDRASSPGPFCSHPDQGRITRIAGRTPVWAQLAARSIRRYHDIAVRSGIRFHTVAGLAVAVPTLDDWIDAGLVMGSDIRKVEPDWLQSTTGIAITNGLPIGFEGAPAGHINPRRLVAAQTRLAEVAGATVINDAVTSLSRANEGFEITGAWGTVTAGQVLVATGGFGRELIERELVLHRRARTHVMAEMVDPGGIPSLIVRQPPDERLDSIYWVPPVEYPDGRLCLKIGGAMTDNTPVESAEELVDWFHTDGHEEEIEALQASLRGLLPDVEFASFHSTPCVITETPSEHPYVGFIDDGLAVAIGGNGSAAKSSDELGRLAATMFSEEGWTDSIDQDVFKPMFA